MCRKKKNDNSKKKTKNFAMNYDVVDTTSKQWISENRDRDLSRLHVHVMISNPSIPFKRSCLWSLAEKAHTEVEHGLLVAGNLKKLKVFEAYIFKSNYTTNINYTCILKLEKNRQ